MLIIIINHHHPVPTFSMKVSLLVILRQPKSVSWTIPITGRFDWGDTMHLGTIISSKTSALVSNDWGTCIFISSPSKSALYGDVTDKFNRKVEYGMILILCPIIDILCRLGCLLKRTKSPSFKCRSTWKQDFSTLRRKMRNLIKNNSKQKRSHLVSKFQVMIATFLQISEIKPLTIFPYDILGTSFTRRRIGTIFNKLLQPILKEVPCIHNRQEAGIAR